MTFTSRWPWERTLADDIYDAKRPVDKTPHVHFHVHSGIRHSHEHVHPETHAHSSRSDTAFTEEHVK